MDPSCSFFFSITRGLELWRRVRTSGLTALAVAAVRIWGVVAEEVGVRLRCDATELPRAAATRAAAVQIGAWDALRRHPCLPRDTLVQRPG